jgi:hypothetical protein
MRPRSRPVVSLITSLGPLRGKWVGGILSLTWLLLFGLPPLGLAQPKTVEALQNVTLRESPPRFQMFQYVSGKPVGSVARGEVLTILDQKWVGIPGSSTRWVLVQRSSGTPSAGWVEWGPAPSNSVYFKEAPK